VLDSSSLVQESAALDAGAELGRRRLLRTAVEKWLKPRAQAVKRLLVMCVLGSARRLLAGWPGLDFSGSWTMHVVPTLCGGLLLPAGLA
jgi:hypothetical protein